MKHYQSNIFTDLPVIIDGPGQYRTRGGNIAHVDKIRTVNSAKDMPPPTFAAFGHIEHRTTRATRSEFTTWHVSGRNMAISTNSNDIVRKD